MDKNTTFKDILKKHMITSQATAMLSQSYTELRTDANLIATLILTDYCKDYDFYPTLVNIGDIDNFLIEKLTENGRLKESEFFQSELKAKEKGFWWCDEIEKWIHLDF